MAEYKCPMCEKEEERGDSSEIVYSSKDILEAHVASEHFDCLPYQCEKCRFSKFPTEFALRYHYESDHGMKRYFVS